VTPLRQKEKEKNSVQRKQRRRKGRKRGSEEPVSRQKVEDAPKKREEVRQSRTIIPERKKKEIRRIMLSETREGRTARSVKSQEGGKKEGEP